MPTKKPESYVYGKSKNPTSWHETSQILKNQKPKKKKSSGLLDKLDQLLKQRKG